MAIVLGNRAKMSTSTTGTGTITLGSALSGYQTFAQAGITNGQTVRYTIEDGTNFEIGSGVFTSSGTTLTRNVTESTNSDNAINLSGSGEVFITASAADIFVNDGATSLTTTGVGTFASLDISGDIDVDGTTNLDAVDIDGAVNIAADLTIASTNKILFNDASQFIQGSSATVLSIAATDEIDLTATTIDINGAVALNGAVTGATNVTLSGELDAATGDFATSIAVANVDIATGAISLRNGGTQSYIRFYCESSNAHYAQLQAPAHSAFSGNVTLTLPATTDTIAGIAATQTFTNKTLTSPKINEDVAVTTTATEINLIDGGTSRGTTAVASGDGILINDAGTMRMTNVDTVSTYFSGHSVGGGNIVTTGALNSGSITSGFGAIDNGSSNITTTGVGTFASLDISGNIDVDGTTNLDAVDIDGAVQLDATLTVGVDDTGYDVKFFGDTASAFMQWDASVDDLILGGAAGLVLPKDKLTIDSTAVTTTAAELNKLDGAGTLKQAGLETIWIPATAMYPATTNGSSALTQVETTALRPDLMVLDFAAAADDFAQFSIGFPKSWNEGTVTFQVFWTPSNTNTDDCIWSLQGVSVADGATIDVAYGTAVSVTDAGIGTVEDQQVSPVSGAVTITNAAVDTQTYFQIFRDGNAAGDDFSGVARLLGVKIFFTTDAANDA